jgi:hypothetical protein
MKLFVKLMLALLVLALLLPFTILKDDQGKTLMSFSSLKLPDFSLSVPSMPSAKNLVPAASESHRMDVFYKWYDASGNLQFSTAPPPAGIEYTVKQFDPDTNVIEAVSLPVAEPPIESSANAPSAGLGRADMPGDLGNPYDKENIKKLFEDAENVEKLLQQRLNNQNSAIN